MIRISLSLLLLFSVCYTKCYSNNILQKTLKNCSATFEGDELEKQIFEIEGVAKFIPHQFIDSPQEMNTHLTQDISLIQSWNNQPDSLHKLPAFGYGTYYFNITIPEKYVGRNFIIRPNHFIAYASQIMINGQQVCHNGYVGVSSSDTNYLPYRNTIVNSFTADQSHLHVVIWVSNFDHFRGGIFNPIQFGLAKNMIIERERNISKDLWVIICLVVMFLYHLIIFFVNTRERTALYFSLTCLIFAVDFSFQDSMSFFLYFPQSSFKLGYILHHSMPYLLPSSFVFFLHSLFPNEVSIKIRNITGVITIALIAATIILDSSLIQYIARPHYAYVLMIVFYVYYVSIKALKNKREESKLFFISYLLFSLLAINDILYVSEIIHTASLVSTGLIAFVFLLSIIQGRRLANMYNKNLHLSNNLKELNVSLEKKVIDRTHKLNENINQMNKLTQFKEDMTNMVIHDLKAPINSIINAEIIPDHKDRNLMVKRSGYNMLNMVENILDVYKAENTELTLFKQDFKYSELMDQVMEEIGYSLQAHSINLQEVNRLNYLINGDKNILQRVIINIISNAIKFAPTGSIIRMKSILNNGGVLKISISNDGPAIPAKEQKTIFDRFKQTKQGIQKSGSTGIGLTFCKLAVETHGGQIGVISENKGAEFWIEIPHVKEVNYNYLLESENKTKLRLSEANKTYLKPFITQLKQHKAFEIWEINQIIKTINRTDAGIDKWLKLLEAIIYSGDDKAFQDALIMGLKFS
ncbi:sensor histidine kinase [Labilibacter marinus]|uniref:sensor histidine kinase n=1 Tax=Labilibacter marinus TaxID=1477105 RepID=UPI00082C8500|nr:sensor histidine kinase [Labilibacter marinus]